ncbi:hypothetical protein [Halobacteriovorax sp.]|uniref:hypothetical protein n=1 Tax=Halobacteriovorax sp. TaxID=2020862 RepID=UPI003566A3E3
MELKDKYDDIVNSLANKNIESEDEILFFSNKSKVSLSANEMNAVSEYVRETVKKKYSNSMCTLKVNISTNIDVVEMKNSLRTFNRIFNEFIQFIYLSRTSEAVINVELLKNKVRIRNVWKNTRGEAGIFDDILESLEVKRDQFNKVSNGKFDANISLLTRHRQTELCLESDILENISISKNIVKERVNNEKSF